MRREPLGGRERRRVYSRRNSSRLATRVPKNPAEGQLARELSANGWTCIKRGWPDFFCFRGGQVMCVEVKAHQHTPLRLAQSKIMRALAAAGIHCAKWTPDGGFERIQPEWEEERHEKAAQFA